MVNVKKRVELMGEKIPFLRARTKSEIYTKKKRDKREKRSSGNLKRFKSGGEKLIDRKHM